MEETFPQTSRFFLDKEGGDNEISDFFSLGDLFLNLELYELPGVPEMMTCFEDV